MKKRRFNLSHYYYCFWIIFAFGISCAELPLDDSDTGSEVDTDSFGNDEEGQVNDSAGFYVRAFQTNDSVYFIHKDEAHMNDAHSQAGLGGFDKECSIDMDATFDATTHDIICTIEIPELDLRNAGLTMQFNVPSDSGCTWLRRDSYYYYNFEPKALADPASIRSGSTDITFSYFVDPDTDRKEYLFACLGAQISANDVMTPAERTAVEANPNELYDGSGTTTFFTCDPTTDFPLADGGPYTGFATGDGVTPFCSGENCYVTEFARVADGDAGTFQSSFDYSTGNFRSVLGSAGAPGPNCAGGEYHIREWIFNETDNQWELDSQPGVAFGGDPANCLTGVGFEAPFNGLLIDDFIEDVGINGTYVLPQLQNSGLGSAANVKYSNLFTANWFDPTDVPDNIGADIEGNGASLQDRRRQYYDFQCLDRSEELKARIRVLVREWNLYSEFTSFNSTGSGDPDGGTSDGTPYTADDLNYFHLTPIAEPVFGSFFLNDSPDWVDFLHSDRDTADERCYAENESVTTINPNAQTIFPGFCD